MLVEGRKLYSNGSSEDTSTVLKNRGILMGTELERIAEISACNAEVRVHIFVSLVKCGNADEIS